MVMQKIKMLHNHNLLLILSVTCQWKGIKFLQKTASRMCLDQDDQDEDPFLFSQNGDKTRFCL